LTGSAHRLELLTSATETDILGLTEHYLKEGNIHMGCIKDFYVASYFCQEVKSKGGCLILVREGIDSVAINVDGFNKEQCCEIA